MLRLAQQIRRDKCGVGRIVRNDEDFARPCNHIDRDLAEHLSFCLGNIGVAGADDFIHLRDGFRAIGQRGNRLRTARFKNTIHPRELCRRENRRGNRPVCIRRRNHHNQRTAREFRGNCVHKHRGRVARRAAGNIQTHLFDGRDLLTNVDAIRAFQPKAFAQLHAVERADVLRRGLHGKQQVLRNRGKRRVQFGRRNLQRGQLRAVKPPRIIDERAVAFFRNRLDDLAHRICNAAAFQRSKEEGLFVHLIVGKNLHLPITSSRPRTSRSISSPLNL
ncbi:hypothetical protein SDC9_113968 [bioreactor metagenome]|uniref:Uncharacterized protein n=1 Tax=bioreactor metagenome TaxID=1076179 RepID=A0A645BPC0_9ZZZZ